MEPSPARTHSENWARQIFDHAEAALVTNQALPVDADVHSSRPIRMLGEKYLRDSIARGEHPRTMKQRASRLHGRILPTIGDVPVTKWRIEHSRPVMEEGGKTLFSTRGGEDLHGQLTAMRKLAGRLGWLDRSMDPLDGLEITHATCYTARPHTTSIRACVPRPVRCARWPTLPTCCAVLKARTPR